MISLTDALSELKSKQEQEPDEKPMNLEWEKTKGILEGMSPDYDTVIRKNLSKVRKTSFGQSTRLLLPMGTCQGYETQLTVYEGKETKAFYSLFNPVENMAYVRKLTE